MVFEMNRILYLLILVCLFFSCEKNKDINPLENTEWIHEFQENEHIVDAKAAVYIFGSESVEYYAIGKDGKSIRRLGIYPYSLNKNILTIGIKNSVLSNNSFYMNQMLFIKRRK